MKTRDQVEAEVKRLQLLKRKKQTEVKKTFYSLTYDEIESIKKRIETLRWVLKGSTI
jgi:hypothetical protein